MSAFELDVSSMDLNAPAGREPSELSSPPPICVLVIGMAGAGKTSLMQRINLEMIEKQKKAYYVNLDPATVELPFAANIDIRDTVQYKEVMKQVYLRIAKMKNDLYSVIDPINFSTDWDLTVLF